MNDEFAHAESPAEVLKQTANGTDPAGDDADQADRLTMVMEAEALHNALTGDPGGEGSFDGVVYPRHDAHEFVNIIDEEDSRDFLLSDDSIDKERGLSPEQAAMHIIEVEADDVSTDSHAVGVALTAEDETLLGLDHHE
jgi:hypothetical protein